MLLCLLIHTLIPIILLAQPGFPKAHMIRDCLSCHLLSPDSGGFHAHIGHVGHLCPAQ